MREVATLTLEHIPAQSTGNRGTVRVEVFGHAAGVRVTRVALDGLGLRVLCARCNSTTGSRLGTAYADFARQVRRSGNVVTPRRNVVVSASAVYPQRVARHLYLAFVCLANVDDESRLDGLRAFIREDSAPLPDDAPRLSLYHNRSGSFRVAPVGLLRSVLGPEAGWMWTGAEVAHPGLGVVYTFPDDHARPPHLEGTVDVTGWSKLGFRDRRDLTLELPSWRVEHPHPLGAGRPRQVERWMDNLIWFATLDDASDELIRASASVLWRGR